MSDPLSPSSQVVEPPLRILITHEPSAAGPSAALPGGRWSLLKDALEVLSKLLPALAVILVIILFRTEVSEFLKNASKVELLGFKLEKENFDKRLQASAEKLGVQKSNPAWTEVPFRKLKLAAPALKGMQILWVDDHPENNFYLRRILRDVDAQISIALNNTEALDAIKRKDFDLVISDFNRDTPPEETGGELATRIAAISYEAPIIFYTSRPDRIPPDVPRVLATNDPSALLATVAEIAITRLR